MTFGFADPWHVFLPREGGHVVGFMGSGGKTSLQRVVAEVYAAENIPTLLTTTTRCEVLPDLPALTWSALQEADPGSLPEQLYVHSGEGEPGKWAGLTAAQVDSLGARFPERIVLAEVDGAAKYPLKLHRDGEPVWPRRTSLAVVVMGVGAVGGQAGQKIHRWTTVPFAAFAGLPDYTVLEWSHVADLLLADGGYLAQVPAEVPAVLALTGLADQDDSIGLFGFVGQAMENPALPLALFCSLGADGWDMRTAYAEREEDAL